VRIIVEDDAHTKSGTRTISCVFELDDMEGDDVGGYIMDAVRAIRQDVRSLEQHEGIRVVK
jgi:hypothetical protein